MKFCVERFTVVNRPTNTKYFEESLQRIFLTLLTHANLEPVIGVNIGDEKQKVITYSNDLFGLHRVIQELRSDIEDIMNRKSINNIDVEIVFVVALTPFATHSVDKKKLLSKTNVLFKKLEEFIVSQYGHMEVLL